MFRFMCHLFVERWIDLLHSDCKWMRVLMASATRHERGERVEVVLREPAEDVRRPGIGAARLALELL
jgi:hypothetical protein